MSTKNVTLKEKVNGVLGDTIFPATTSPNVYDSAKSQALSQTLVNTPDYETLGFAKFSTATAYNTGDKVYKDNGLYRFIADKTAGEWDVAKVEPWSIEQEIEEVDDAIRTLIPSQASADNKLADKEYVNDKVSTDTATFRGTFNLVTDLELTIEATQGQIATALGTAISDEDKNDYAFVQIPTSDATPTEIAHIDRYKYTSLQWAFEYSLNNSGFTSEQWAAINSGITSSLVAAFGAKYDKPAGGIPASDMNTSTFDAEPTAGSDNLVKSGGVALQISQLGKKIGAINLNILLNREEAFDYRTTAHYYTPNYLRVKGQIITFLVTDGEIDKWVTEQFVGDDLSTWNTTEGWNTIHPLNGYVYKGVAVAGTNPGTPKEKVFYFGIAAGATYTYFNNIQHDDNYLLNILRWDGSSWQRDTGIHITGNVEDYPEPIKASAVKRAIDPLKKSIYFSTNNTLTKNVIGLYLTGLDASKTYRADYVGYYPDDGAVTLFVYEVESNTLVTAAYSYVKNGLIAMNDRGYGISGYCILDFENTATDQRVGGFTIRKEIVSNLEYSPGIQAKLTEIAINGLPQYTNNTIVEQFIKYVCIDGYTENNTPRLGFYIASNYINIQLLNQNNVLKISIDPAFNTLVDDVQYFSATQNGITLNIAINLKGLYNAKYAGTALSVYASEYNYAFRYPIPISGKIDKINFDKTDNFIVDVNGGGDFTSLTQAILYATVFMDRHIYVNAGTYDIIQEFIDIYGENFFTNYVHGNLRGIYLKNRVHIHFSPSAKVVCNYTGDNSDAQLWFAPFNSGIYGFEIDGLHLESSRVRYSIHDERDQDADGYYNIYRNCDIKHDKQDGAGYIACIGGGLGKNGKILVENCIFNSVGVADNHGIVSWHNSAASGKSFLTIKDSYFVTGTFRIGYYGTSTEITKAIVTNCSMKSAPFKSAEASSTNDNMELIAWNNEIRQ